MDIDYEVRAYLLSKTAITDLIETRIYPLHLPQSPQFPAITFQVVGTTGINTLDAPMSLIGTTIQIDSWANTHIDVKSLAGAVRAILNGYQGLLSTKKAQDIVYKNEVDLRDPETNKFRVVQFYEVWHTIS